MSFQHKSSNSCENKPSYYSFKILIWPRLAVVAAAAVTHFKISNWPLQINYHYYCGYCIEWARIQRIAQTSQPLHLRHANVYQSSNLSNIAKSAQVTVVIDLAFTANNFFNRVNKGMILPSDSLHSFLAVDLRAIIPYTSCNSFRFRFNSVVW